MGHTWIKYLNFKNGSSGQYQKLIIDVTQRRCLENTICLMYMTLSSLILELSCTNIKQTNFQKFSQHTLLNMFKRTTIKQGMPKIIVSIKQRKFSLIKLFGIVDHPFGIH